MTSIPDRLVIASRGSRLALRQASIVSDLIKGAHPHIEVQVLTVGTRGDADKSRPFRDMGAKGIFTTEVEKAVCERRADLAVHSAKDLTAELSPDCSIVCVPPRASVSDVVVGGRGASGEERLASLAEGARIGTSSMRRRVLVREARPDLEIAELRGNLDTRLRKVSEEEVDAAVLALAGLERLGGVDPAGYGTLEPTRWVPAPAQGALAVEALSERSDLAHLLAPFGDPATWAAVTCERAFGARLEGGCSVPLGCVALPGPAGLLVTGLLGSPYGEEVLRDRISGPVSDAGRLGAELADAILGAGGREILDEIGAGDELEEVSEP